jgi:hypothetical protein
LTHYLRSSYRYDECESWKETLCERLAVSLKKGKAKEAHLACLAMALLVLTLGADEWTEEAVTSEFLPLLQHKMVAAASPAAKVAAIRSLGVLCFVASSDSNVLQDCIEKVQKLFSSASKEVRSESYTVLSLLMSISIPIGPEIVEHLLRYVQSFSKALGDESVEVRTAAGNALVVVNEVFGEIIQDNDEEKEEEEALVDGELVERMSELATSSWSNASSGMRMNKREKANQRKAFRGLLDAMEGTGSKESKIKLKHGDVLVLDTQSLRVTASVFKSVLLNGFQVHMQTNDLLHQIFNFQPRQEKIHLSQLEKKMMFSPNSAAKKSQTKERKKGRMQKSASNLDFYQED